MSLTIKINSFSYLASGIPKDESGNGGGFVFDCRFINNPGRVEEFRNQTGKDKEVKDFLENQYAMNKFLENVKAIIEPAIENYLERSFTNLMINFGCTGGRHRSVYSAELIKEHIIGKYPSVTVKLNHIELEKESAQKDLAD